MLTVIAVDLGPRRVRLCKWDAAQAVARSLPARPPAGAWIDWLRAIDAPPRHEIVFRCTNADVLHDTASDEPEARNMPVPAALREAVSETARSGGARWIRFISGGATSDPAMAAARHLADRTRWTSLLSVERDDGVFRIGLQDRRGKVGAYVAIPALVEDELNDHERSPLTRTAAELLQRPIRADESTDASASKRDTRGLICLGDGAEDWGTMLSRALERSTREFFAKQLLIPPNPETWPLLGMMIAPIELHFHRDLVGQTLTAAELRSAFADLMDAACDAITREGFDLDDAESTRWIEPPDETGGEWTELEALLAGAKRAAANEPTESGLRPADSADAEQRFPLHALHVHSIIRPTAPDWAIDIAPPLIS